MAVFRRRDTGAAVEARQVVASEGEDYTGGRVMTVIADGTGGYFRDSEGVPLRLPGPPHQVHAAKGEWIITEGDAVSVLSDEHFGARMAEVADQGALLHIDDPAAHMRAETARAEHLVATGQGFMEAARAGQDPVRVQLHNAVVYMAQGHMELAQKLMDQPIMPEWAPKTLDDLIARADEYVDIPRTPWAVANFITRTRLAMSGGQS